VNELKYKVDGWNNFCRVFEIPEKFPSGFLFGGGKPVNFQMVDWFNPVMGVPQPAVTKEVWKEKVGEIETVEISISEIEKNIIPFLKEKNYINPELSYLILYDFGASTVFRFS